MITAKHLLEMCIMSGITEFVGVPDSTLAEFSAAIDADKRCNNLITVNEGSAIAYASGYYIATGRQCCVYLQNSGLGNAVNPIMSLSHKHVYDIPMFMIVGWRGAPGVKDEPQHKAMGDATLRILGTLGFTVNDLEKVEESETFNTKNVAIVVKPKEFESYTYDTNNSYTRSKLSRRQAIKMIVENSPKDSIFVCTTGKASRELYEVRKELNLPNTSDFLNVGAMGHVSMIALGIAKNTERNVVCIDGDGSALMHLGNVYQLLEQKPENLKYILLDNHAHDSVGGHNVAVNSLDLRHMFDQVIDTCTILRGYDGRVKSSISENEYVNHILINRDNDENLSRPKESFSELRDSLMNNIRSLK